MPARPERSTHAFVRVERDQLVEGDLHDEPCDEDRNEHEQRAGEAAERVACVRDRRGVDQSVHATVGVRQHRHAEQHRNEERQYEPEQQRLRVFVSACTCVFVCVCVCVCVCMCS